MALFSVVMNEDPPFTQLVPTPCRRFKKGPNDQSEFLIFRGKGKRKLQFNGGGGELNSQGERDVLTTVKKWRSLRESGSFNKEGKQSKERLEKTLCSVGIVFLRAIAMAL